MEQVILIKSRGTDWNYFWKKKMIISFILSVFVVLIHSSSFSSYFQGSPESVPGAISFINYFFRGSLSLVAVPLFFILSGFVMFRNFSKTNALDKIKKKLLYLIIPYLVWNILSMLFYIITSYSFISNYFVGRQKFVFSLSNVLLSVFKHQCNGPFWYIFALMLYTALSPVIAQIIRNKYIGLIFIVCLILVLICGIQMPSWLILESNSIVFYVLGCWLGTHKSNLFIKKAYSRTSLLALLCLLLTLIYFIAEKYNIIPSIYGLKTIFLLFAALSFWFASDLFIDYIKPKKFHQYSFLIYAMHVNVQAIYVKIIYLVFPKSAVFSIFNFVVSTVLTILTIIIFGQVCRRISPKLYALLTGDR